MGEGLRIGKKGRTFRLDMCRGEHGARFDVVCTREGFEVWYSWVGSNHRPPVPQKEYDPRKGYAGTAKTTKKSMRSVAATAVGRLAPSPISAIVVASW